MSVRDNLSGGDSIKIEQWDVSGNSYSARTKTLDTSGYSKITVVGGVKADGANALSFDITGNVSGKSVNAYNYTLVIATANITGSSVTLSETHNKSGSNVNATYKIILEA